MFKFNVTKPLIILFLAAAAAILAGCSGGGDGGGNAGTLGTPTPSVSSIPASALASVDGLVAFMSKLIDAGADDTSEPIALGDASLPVDDSI